MDPFNNTTQGLGLFEIAFFTAFITLIFIRLFYHLLYGKVVAAAKKSQNSPSTQKVSIVVVLRDNFDFINNNLPLIMEQEYGDFEVVLVEVGSSDEFSDLLKVAKERYPQLTITNFKRNERFYISTKMSLNVGIKASKYDNIITITPDTKPASKQWLSSMAMHFDNRSIILGYCAIERQKGFKNRLIRTSRLMMTTRYIAAAITGRPYRGVLQNMGFSKKEYFAVGGFNFLNMDAGEDDLFIQKIANESNVGIVFSAEGKTVQNVWGDSNKSWNTMRRKSSYCYNYYPRWAKNYLQTDSISGALFWILSIFGLVMLNLYFKLILLIIITIYLGFTLIQFARITKQVGEKGLNKAFIVYTIAYPFYELWLYVVRKVIKPKDRWR